MQNANFKFFIFNFTLCILPSLGPCYFDPGELSQRQAVLQSRFDKALEEGMTIHRTGLELGVELAAKEPGMIFNLNNLNQAPVWRKAARDHPMAAKEFAAVVVEFIAMAMALRDLFLAVEF